MARGRVDAVSGQFPLRRPSLLLSPLPSQIVTLANGEEPPVKKTDEYVADYIKRVLSVTGNSDETQLTVFIKCSFYLCV